jgi:O-antigen/teichoic acid export membrane protein
MTSAPDPSADRLGPGITSAAAWNMAALGVSGVAGVVLLILVGARFGAATLGTFNLQFAVFLVAGQVAVLGMQASTVRAVAIASDLRTRQLQLRGALLATAMVAGAVALVLWVSRDLVAAALGRPALATGIGWVALATLLFALNKVLLAALNGFSRFRAFAALTAGRALLLLTAFGLLALLGVEGDRIVLILPMAEGVLLLAGLTSLAGELTGRRLVQRNDPTAGTEDVPPSMLATVRGHLRFGSLGFGSSLLQELNVRIDVIVLSLFVGDELLGVYSLAAILVEAIAQVPIVLRTVLAPRVILMLERRDRQGLAELVDFVRPRLRSAMVVIAVIAVAAYPSAILLVTGDTVLAGGRVPFAILMAGTAFAAGYAPFGLLLIQAGRPAEQTVLTLAIVLINVVGNLLLIPAFGLQGAAVATSVSLVGSVGLLRWTVGRRLDLHLVQRP